MFNQRSLDPDWPTTFGLQIDYKWYQKSVPLSTESVCLNIYRELPYGRIISHLIHYFVNILKSAFRIALKCILRQIYLYSCGFDLKNNHILHVVISLGKFLLLLGLRSHVSHTRTL